MSQRQMKDYCTQSIYRRYSALFLFQKETSPYANGNAVLPFPT